MIVGITTPTSGSVQVNGRVTALLELGAGFTNDLTGRDNLRLRATALGLSRDEILEIEPKVIEFSELGIYIDQPLRTYSSGMRSRLGFALAINLSPDILIIDEALAVGDKHFRNKCLKRVREVISSDDVTVLFVAHAIDQAREFCDRGMVLVDGVLVFDGDIDAAAEFYGSM